jgi:hypothetical protein
VFEKPHMGINFVPFINSITLLFCTKLSMRCFVSGVMVAIRDRNSGRG